MELSQFARDYLSLGLRINKHIDGYVEHYYGPSEIKTKIQSEKAISPKKLLKDCRELVKSLPNQGFNEKRSRFLYKNLIAIETILNRLNGERLPYIELVEKLFDFCPILYPDDYFYDLSTQANELYLGVGPLSERIETYGSKRTIKPSDLKLSFLKSLKIVKKKTNDVFPDLLPKNEKIEIREVNNKSWPMYCWYQGHYNSIIDINLDRVHYWTHLINYMSHEGYPGHHTERSVKESLLYRRNNIFECSVLLIYTPEMVMSEGMGITAENVIFNPEESIKILTEDFFYGIDENIEILTKQDEIRKGFRRLESNLAYKKYVNSWSNNDIVNFLKDLEIIPEKVIDGILTFISDEIWAPYMQTYQGERLITNKFGQKPSPQDFTRILTEQTLPSDLV